MPFEWAAHKTRAEHNQPFGMHASCVNYSYDCQLFGRPSLALHLLVTAWAASIVQASATWVVLDLAYQHLA